MNGTLRCGPPACRTACVGVGHVYKAQRLHPLLLLQKNADHDTYQNAVRSQSRGCNSIAYGDGANSTGDNMAWMHDVSQLQGGVQGP